MNNERDNLRYMTEKIKRMSEADKQAFDGGGGGGYDGGMDERVKKLETLVEKTVERVVNIERDVAVMRSNYATGKDVSDAKSTIVLWVVGAIFVAQLLPLVKDFIAFSSTVAPPAQSSSVPAKQPSK